ncbi:hypothetical protein [uncultured Sunxiuqinia sp.]|uniref:hypothetical protein n=1 Tax=uncultured Sunxiuqinia sp. TaxID=1573825 RepID=UPI002AA78638|nr:hypothetical protein [uncultured Sunxiuqinia sp.]
MGRYDCFYYLVYYNEDQEVEFVRVTKYYSDHGGEVQWKRWLEQFVGYEGGDLDYGEEVQAISGASPSGRSNNERDSRNHNSIKEFYVYRMVKVNWR